MAEGYISGNMCDLFANQHLMTIEQQLKLLPLLLHVAELLNSSPGDRPQQSVFLLTALHRLHQLHEKINLDIGQLPVCLSS